MELRAHLSPASLAASSGHSGSESAASGYGNRGSDVQLRTVLVLGGSAQVAPYHAFCGRLCACTQEALGRCTVAV